MIFDWDYNVSIHDSVSNQIIYIFFEWETIWFIISFLAFSLLLANLKLFKWLKTSNSLRIKCSVGMKFQLKILFHPKAFIFTHVIFTYEIHSISFFLLFMFMFVQELPNYIKLVISFSDSIFIHCHSNSTSYILACNYLSEARI